MIPGAGRAVIRWHTTILTATFPANLAAGDVVELFDSSSSTITLANFGASVSLTVQRIA